MDQLEVIITKEKTTAEVVMKEGKLVPDELDCVNFYINGKSLIEMVGEQLHKDSDTFSAPNYGYLGLDPKDILLPYSNILIEPDKTESCFKEENGKILVSRCELCGEALCSGFALRITVEKNKVIWDQIGYWHDTRIEGVVGPFEFDRKEYEQALRIENAKNQAG